MALTNAQRQANYRQRGMEARAPKARIEVFKQIIDRAAKDRLEWLAHLDFAQIERIVQADIDDASQDHYYVGAGTIGTPGLGAIAADLGFIPGPAARCLEALAYAAGSMARIWRANGGVGRVVVKVAAAERGLEMELCVWKSPHDEMRQLMSA